MNTVKTRILWKPDAADRYSIDRVTVWRWQREGKLPAPDVKIGDREGWYESTLERHERASQPAQAA